MTRPAIAGIVAVALACLSAPPAQAADLPIVAAIKAAYLTKFMPFVEFASGGSQAASDRLTVCVLYDDQIAGLVELAAAKNTPNSQPIEVRRLSSGMSASPCQILFIGDTDRARVAAVLAAVGAAPILTVTSEAAEGPKGIVNFVVRADRVRFEIDDSEAARHGLKLSSKLLSVAISVKPRDHSLHTPAVEWAIAEGVRALTMRGRSGQAPPHG